MVVIASRRRSAVGPRSVGPQTRRLRSLRRHVSPQAFPIHLPDVWQPRRCRRSVARHSAAGLQASRSTPRPCATQTLGLSHCEECLFDEAPQEHFRPARELSLTDYLPAKLDGGLRQIEIADWSHLPEDDFLRSELSTVLKTAIAELPELYRSVLLLRDVEGLRTEETAEVLELTVDTVKQRLHRARLAVRAKVDEYLRKVETTAHGT